MNWPCADGWPSDSWYCVIAPRSPFANPMFVLSGFEPSVLKLIVPLYEEARCAGRVVCSTKRPVLMLCAPFTFVRLPETLKSVLKPKNGHRLSELNDATELLFTDGMPPANVAFGSR